MAPSAHERFYTTTEAAVLADVPKRAVDKAIEDRVIASRKGALSAVGRGRRRRAVRLISEPAICYLALVQALELPLKKDQKSRLFAWLNAATPEDDGGDSFDLSDLVTIRPANILAAVRRRVADYRAISEAHIVIDDDVMGGTPCIRGSRVTVYALADRVVAGESHGEIIEDYPELTTAIIDTAVTYAKAHPLVGRPSGRPWRTVA